MRFILGLCALISGMLFTKIVNSEAGSVEPPSMLEKVVLTQIENGSVGQTPHSDYVNGSYYKTAEPANGYLDDGTGKYFFKDGKRQSGLQTIGSKTYYFDSVTNLAVKNQLKSVDKHTYYLASDGSVQYRVNGNFQTKLIAHRGASNLAPENSIPAFQLAKGSYGAETDIWLTKDKQWVVSHDGTIDRMTNGHGAIKDLTLAQIKQYHIDSGVNVGKYQSLTLPTLKEYLTEMSNNNLRPIIEIKQPASQMSDGDVQNLIAAVKNAGLYNNSTIISLQCEALKHVYALDKKISLELLWDSASDPVQLSEKLNELGPKAGLDINGKKLTSQTIQALRQQGRRLNVWTISPSEFPYYIGLGVDEITTDANSFSLN